MKLFLFSCTFVLTAVTSFSQPYAGSQLFPMSVNGVWGYIDNEGKQVIAPQYQGAHYFYEGLAAIKKEGKWGFIDSKNRIVIEPEHDTTLHFSEGWCAVGYAEEGMPMQWNYIDAKGKTIGGTLPILGYVTNFNNNRAMVSAQGMDDPIIINRKGEQVIKQGDYFFFTDEGSNFFSEGVMKVMKPIAANGITETLLIDTAGKILTDYKLDYPATGHFHEGMMWFQKDLKYGFLDKTGREVIKAEYDTVTDFSEGWACVWKGMEFNPNSNRLEGGTSGYINHLGEWVLEPKARQSFGFHDGFARVYKDGKWGYMNTLGSIAVPIEYNEAADFFRGFAKVKKESRWHYINTRGKIVWSEPLE